MDACGVQVVLLEHGTLVICNSPVCALNVENHLFYSSAHICHSFHPSLWTTAASGTARYAKRRVSYLGVYQVRQSPSECVR